MKGKLVKNNNQRKFAKSAFRLKGKADAGSGRSPRCKVYECMRAFCPRGGWRVKRGASADVRIRVISVSKNHFDMVLVVAWFYLCSVWSKIYF